MDNSELSVVDPLPPLTERSPISTTFFWGCNPLGKTHIKKVFFFSGRTTKDLTPPPNGLVVHATFDLILTKKISKIFGLKKSDFF